MAADNGGWQTARDRRRKGSKWRDFVRQPVGNSVIAWPGGGIETLEQIIPKVKRSLWYLRTLKLIREALGTRNVKALVCLGMGTTIYQNARHQYACAIALWEEYSPGDVMVYDPACTTRDDEIATSRGWRIGSNETDFAKDSRTEDDGVVMLFMPHCHQELYSTVLEYLLDNYGLKSVILLGNKLQPVSEFAKAKCSPRYVELLCSQGTLTRQCGSEKESTLITAFNDLAVTTFSE